MLFDAVGPHTAHASPAHWCFSHPVSLSVPGPWPRSRLTHRGSPYPLVRYYDQQRSRPLLATSLACRHPVLHARRPLQVRDADGLITVPKWASYATCDRCVSVVKEELNIAMMLRHRGRHASVSSFPRILLCTRTAKELYEHPEAAAESWSAWSVQNV